MKRRATRERLEAEMRLRHSTERLKRLQRRLDITGHPKGDLFRTNKIADFWESVRFDKRIAKGEI